MDVQRSRRGPHPQSWPRGLEVLRFVTRALAVRPPRRGSPLGSKQTQRFFRGRLAQVSPERLRDILVAIVQRYLVEDPVVVALIPSVDGGPAATGAIAWTLFEHLSAWDTFVTSLNLCAKSAAERRRPASLDAQLRFAVIELGIWFGTFCCRDRRPPPAVDTVRWTTAPAKDRYLRDLLKARKITRDDFQARLGLKTPNMVDRWCDRGARPKDPLLGRIAQVLESDPERGVACLQSLRRHYALRQFAHGLATRVGRSTVDEMVQALYRVAHATYAHLTGTRLPVSVHPPICDHVLSRWMKSAPSHRLLRAIEANEPSLAWRTHVRALRVAAFRVRFTEGLSYPRVPLYTDFDATRSDLWEEEIPDPIPAPT